MRIRHAAKKITKVTGHLQENFDLSAISKPSLRHIALFSFFNASCISLKITVISTVMVCLLD